MDLSLVLEGVVSAGLFLLLWLTVGRHGIRPFFALLDEREARTSGAEKRAADIWEKSRELRNNIEAELRQTRFEAIKRRDAAVAAAKARAQEQMQAASAHAEQRIEQARQDLEGERAEAAHEVDQEAERLAQAVVQKILEPVHSPTVH